MSDEYLRNKVKELSLKWRESKEPQYIQEVISIAKQIKNERSKKN